MKVLNLQMSLYIGSKLKLNRYRLKLIAYINFVCEIAQIGRSNFRNIERRFRQPARIRSRGHVISSRNNDNGEINTSRHTSGPALSIRTVSRYTSYPAKMWFLSRQPHPYIYIYTSRKK